jgi:hypothetical protein
MPPRRFKERAVLRQQLDPPIANTPAATALRAKGEHHTDWFILWYLLLA